MNSEGSEREDLNVLVLGVGNVLLSDEGVGPKVIEELTQTYQSDDCVEFVDGGTMGFDLLPYLDDRSHLVVIDAVNTGKEPGHTVRIVLDDPASFFRTMVSPHQLGLGEVLGVAAMTDNLPPSIVAIGIEPASLETSIELSPEVEKKMPELVNMVVDELGSLGIDIKPVSDA